MTSDKPESSPDHLLHYWPPQDSLTDLEAFRLEGQAI